MALVAYDNSDSSEYEEDEDVTISTTAVLKNVSAPETDVPGPSNVNSHAQSSTSLFNLLPQPSRTKPVPVEEEDDEFLHKKETVTNVVKPKARITVPLLSDFKDVEDSAPNKPRMPSGKKSGLLSMLPQPRNGVISTTTSKSLIPNILKQTKPVAKKPLPSPASLKKETKTLAPDYSDDSDNDEVQNDFFSMNKPEEPLLEIKVDLDPPVSEAPVRSNAPNQKLPPGIQSYFKQTPEPVETLPENAEYEEQGPSYSSYPQEEQDSSELPLDEEALRALCGTRGARRREDIQLLHVDQREVLAEARQLLAKGLMDDTTKRVSSSKRRGDEPSAQQRKKHQITYLAHQAKANEAELQNQWASSRMSRMKTQSKYGF